jgi:DNA-binding MarR family transcriptional regulator
MLDGVCDGSESSHVDVVAAERGLAVLLAACDRAMEEIGSAVPAAQLRALLIIDQAGNMNLNRLTRALDSTPSATSRLTDRMQAAGLLTRDRAAASRREIVLLTTESGKRLADWVRVQRRAALTQVLESISPQAGEALAHGLTELADGGR